MIRKWICLVLSLGVVLLGSGKALASEDGFGPFFLHPSGSNAMDVLCSPAMDTGQDQPRTGSRPAPIIGAMGIAFSVSALMVFADQRKK